MIFFIRINAQIAYRNLSFFKDVDSVWKKEFIQWFYLGSWNMIGQPLLISLTGELLKKNLEEFFSPLKMFNDNPKSMFRGHTRWRFPALKICWNLKLFPYPFCLSSYAHRALQHPTRKRQTILKSPERKHREWKHLPELKWKEWLLFTGTCKSVLYRFLPPPGKGGKIGKTNYIAIIGNDELKVWLIIECILLSLKRIDYYT